MIQDPSKDISLIVYNTPKPPRYLKINKRLLKLLMLIVPLLLIVALFFSLSSSLYMKGKLEVARSKEPAIIASLKDEKKELESQVASLQKVNQTLTQKISQGSQTAPASALALFATPIGYKDLTDKEMAKLENMSANFKQDKIEFRFDLLNNLDSEERLAGYISIIQYSENSLEIYPKYDLTIEENKLDFAKGESFVVSRFRPVIAEFNKPRSLSVWYKVFIFSRSGNLVDFKIAGPYQVN